jgi:hypothetical protein
METLFLLLFFILDLALGNSCKTTKKEASGAALKAGSKGFFKFYCPG